MALTIVSASEPVWANAEHTMIDLTVRFAELGSVPFLATKDDTEPHGKILFERAVAGAYGAVAPYPKSSAQDLADYKTSLMAKVDAKAEQIRGTYLTIGSGQAMVYQRKGEEVARLANDPDPDPANYPILSATVGIEGATIQEVAALVNATQEAWVKIAAAIETARLGGKAAIDAATSVQAANEAFDAIKWPPNYPG
ncbi:hypothetical protein [Bradyrhizobium sp. 2S1]|uniref:hypothetical protein n=1 Tax=Bradyrhizobium sp. 2S1 TaxID=1404429 RepID=UPI00140C01D5|nr:hypothetical protein [Bradyrhizobium sp. 2S1]MCK7672373.1 hypothetical protein [Bradyrhizobium sp. 2S1]